MAGSGPNYFNGNWRDKSSTAFVDKLNGTPVFEVSCPLCIGVGDFNDSFHSDSAMEIA